VIVRIYAHKKTPEREFEINSGRLKADFNFYWLDGADGSPSTGAFSLSGVI